jgi:hypothetical protein
MTPFQSRILLVAVAAALSLLACSEPEALLMAAKAKPATDVVLLAMTVADDNSHEIRSDGLGEYQNGVDGMTVMIDQFGNLQISPANANGTAAPLRRLNVIYPPGQAWTFPNQWNFKIKSNKTNNANPRIQDMTVGMSGCYNVTIAHRTQSIAYEDAFNPAAQSVSSYVLINRTSPTTWIMNSHGVSSTGLNCGPADMAWVTGTDLTVRRNGGFAVGALSQRFSIQLRRP